MLSLTTLGSLPGLDRLSGRISAGIGRSLRTGAPRLPGEQYATPVGDPGWFGPDSVTWRVHADPSMLVGGIAALLLQTLQPQTMAGVADHSNYREDPLGRLARTSSFVVGTTYGSTEVAERLVRVVKAVHRRVHGTTPEGLPYDASDPALVTWVHTTEVACFLAAHQRFVPFPVRGAAADRYVREMAVVAEALGGTGVPRRRREVTDYFASVQDQLAVGVQAQEAVRFLTTPMRTRGNPFIPLAHQTLLQAAVGILPGWGRRLLGFHQPPAVDLALVRPATHLIMGAMRFAGGTPPPLAEARRRCAAAPGTA